MGSRMDKRRERERQLPREGRKGGWIGTNTCTSPWVGFFGVHVFVVEQVSKSPWDIQETLFFFFFVDPLHFQLGSRAVFFLLTDKHISNKNNLLPSLP